jgi:hypothetical protein
MPATRTARASRRFSRPIVAAIDLSKIFGVRAGAKSDHRFTGVWPIVVQGRVFARSWTQSADGWYRTLLDDPHGVIQVREREVRARGIPLRGERIKDAIDEAYAEKYPTKASQKYVRGFRTPRRRDATIEFVPR